MELEIPFPDDHIDAAVRAAENPVSSPRS
jgi:hypothetical protein